MFEQMKNEEDEIALKRGEGIVDKFVENIKQTEQMIKNENQIKNILKEIETKYSMKWEKIVIFSHFYIKYIHEKENERLTFI